MIIVNAIFPIFALLFLGKLLFQIDITNSAFLKTSDQLVYYIFFPIMLFWKVGSAAPDKATSLNLCIAVIISVLIVYLLSLLAIKIFNITNFKAGSFSQSCYRFNTYIGMAVVMNALGEEGIRYFGIMIGFTIPIINILAVTTLIWFSNKKNSLSQNIKYLSKALVSNPLIIGCFAGLLFANFNFSFPEFIDNTFSLMTSVTMPLALLSIGGSLKLDVAITHQKNAFIASGLKLIVLPLIGYSLLNLFEIKGLPLKAGMIFFTLPTSTAIYVLSAQMDSDTQLASAAIVASTIFSFVFLSIALLI